MSGGRDSGGPPRDKDAARVNLQGELESASLTPYLEVQYRRKHRRPHAAAFDPETGTFPA